MTFAMTSIAITGSVHLLKSGQITATVRMICPLTKTEDKTCSSLCAAVVDRPRKIKSGGDHLDFSVSDEKHLPGCFSERTHTNARQ